MIDFNEEIKKRKLRMSNNILFKSWMRSMEARKMVASVLSALTGIEQEKFMNAGFGEGELPKQNKIVYEKHRLCFCKFYREYKNSL